MRKDIKEGFKTLVVVAVPSLVFLFLLWFLVGPLYQEITDGIRPWLK